MKLWILAPRKAVLLYSSPSPGRRSSKNLKRRNKQKSFQIFDIRQDWNIFTTLKVQDFFFHDYVEITPIRGVKVLFGFILPKLFEQVRTMVRLGKLGRRIKTRNHSEFFQDKMLTSLLTRVSHETPLKVSLSIKSRGQGLNVVFTSLRFQTTAFTLGIEIAL